MSRIQLVWRLGEPIRMTYQVRGELRGLRLIIDGTVFMASMAGESTEIVVPADQYELFDDGARVSLQATTSAGWESVATGFLVKEA